jgi:hypothetical protein
MAALLDPGVMLSFQNTGREAAKTLEFGLRLEDALQRPITWLEWRPPPRRGDPPRMFGFEVVTYATASKKGEPFREMLRALRDYRKIQNKGPVAPWPRSRICTAYLKHRVQNAYIRSLGIEAFDSFVGLRADEPARVSSLKATATQDRAFRTPLADVGITEKDVRAFWAAQSFDLELEPYQGNCTGCFLKDQSDLARVLGEEDTDADWWIDLQDEFPGFGGQKMVPYAQLRAEREQRLAIEAALRDRTPPVNDGSMDPHRFRLVVLQEKRRLAGELPSFSCTCEQTVLFADEEDAA